MGEFKPREFKTVLVTGGAGFIGSNLVHRLLQESDHSEGAGLKIIVFDSFRHGHTMNLNAVKSHPNIRIIHGDIRDKVHVDNAINGVDLVYHLSSIVGIKHYCEDPLEVIDVNVVGTRNVIEGVLKRNIRMLFTSTSEIFGKNPNIPWKEDDDRVLGSTRIERWSYSTSKAVCEQMLFALAKHKGLRCCVVRFFNVYGPRQNPIFVISQGVKRVLRNERPLMYDSGEQSRCFTFVDDAVEGMILAANSEDAIGESFNIGSNIPTCIREVNEIIIEEAGKKGQLQPEKIDTAQKYGDRYEDILNRVPDVTKAAKILNWSAATPLRKGIKIFIEWAKDNQWWLD